MKPRRGSRHRCTECRKWYVPAASAKDSQRICGAPPCRRSRRAALARQRRRRAVQDYRVDERARQQTRRDKLRAAAARNATQASTAWTMPTAGVEVTPRHAPPSAKDPRDLAREMLAAWDEAQALSRATLRRRITGILQGNARSGGTERVATETVSRATLETNPIERIR
jgi:hypothetical protein